MTVDGGDESAQVGIELMKGCYSRMGVTISNEGTLTILHEYMNRWKWGHLEWIFE